MSIVKIMSLKGVEFGFKSSWNHQFTEKKLSNSVFMKIFMIFFKVVKMMLDYSKKRRKIVYLCSRIQLILTCFLTYFFYLIFLFVRYISFCINYYQKINLWQNGSAIIQYKQIELYIRKQKNNSSDTRFL